ncbi:MAG: CRTAC1 family protein [Acidobacteriaceae bacterium]|nr:CRTAC1 family protein [Acidobacteriaceae bacterium]
MRRGQPRTSLWTRYLLILLFTIALWPLRPAASSNAPVHFTLQSIPFRLENDETPLRHAPAAMAGGVAIFDFNGDGRPDIFFTNGANIETLKKDAPRYSNRLFRNDGGGKFTDVTARAGLTGSGYDIGVAAGDYDNDGHPDLFVAGVGANKLYHNNGDGTFTDVTAKAGLNRIDPDYGPMWAVAGAWVDVNNDGWLDLFVVDYLQWSFASEPKCVFGGVSRYCHPQSYKGLPNKLFLNNHDGTFTDVSEASGVRAQIGKGMSVGVADYDGDGWPDLFVPNDTTYNFLFHNAGGKFKEVGFDAGVALPENGNFISGMGLDFRDIDNDGRPDIAVVALNNQTFPIYRNTGKGDFEEITAKSGMSALTRPMSAYGIGIFDFDNDGWKDLFIARGHIDAESSVGEVIDQFNTVMRNLGEGTKWSALTEEAGLDAAPTARHRGCAFGDLDGDGQIDVVVTALGRPAEIWMNRSFGGHWLDVALQGTRSNRDGIGAVVKIITQSGTQWNHMTTSVGYASSSDGPVHFGLGGDLLASKVEIRWPSGTVQILENVRADRRIAVKETDR